MRASRLLGMTALMASLASGPALAAEIKVLTSGAYKPVITALAADFEARTGHRLAVDNDTAGALTQRVERGEAFDLLVLPPGPLKGLGEKGRIDGSTTRPLARVAIGVAVKGEAKPDIGTVAAFRETVLKARKVALIDPAAGGSSGIYLAGLFERMGIADAVKVKAVLVPGGLVAARLNTGEADLAIHQISEILAVPGVTLVGPIPAEIQNYTVYSGALGAAAKERAAAAAFLDWLGGEKARDVLAAKGMEPPGS